MELIGHRDYPEYPNCLTMVWGVEIDKRKNRFVIRLEHFKDKKEKTSFADSEIRVSINDIIKKHKMDAQKNIDVKAINKKVKAENKSLKIPELAKISKSKIATAVIAEQKRIAKDEYNKLMNKLNLNINVFGIAEVYLKTYIDKYQ